MDQVELALNTLYQPNFGAGQKNAERFLLDYQKNPNSWPNSLNLLSTSPSQTVQFFAAQSLYTNLHRDWSKIAAEGRAQIGDVIRSRLQDPSTSNGIVMTKLILAFAVFSIKNLDNNPTYVQEFCASCAKLMENGNLDVRRYFLKLIVQYLTCIPEEGQKVNILFSDGQTASFKVSEICSFALSNVMPLMDDQNVQVQTAALSCVSAWSTYSTIDTESFFPLLEKTVQKLANLDLIETTTDVIMTLLGDTRITGKEKTVAVQIYPVLLNFKEHLSECIRNEADDFVMPFCKLICKYAEIFVRFLVEGLPETKPLFDMIIECTGYPAIYPSNPEVSEITHYLWFSFQDAIDSSNELRACTFSDSSIAMGNQILFEVLNVLIMHTKYPEDRIVASWSADFLDRFKNHRRECGDTSLYCYYSLQDQALGYIVHSFLAELHKVSSDSGVGLQTMEALLFHLKAFSESIPQDENQFVPLIFKEATFLAMSSVINQEFDGTQSYRVTVAALVGSFAEWFSSNPDYLPSVFRFLIGELSQCSNPAPASISLVEICCVCQTQLSPYCDEILNLCIEALSTAPANIKGRIFQSMSYITSALSSEEASPRIVVMVGGIISQLESDLTFINPNQSKLNVDLYNSIILHIEYLKSFCKGSGNAPIDIEISGSAEPLTEQEQVTSKRFYNVVSNLLDSFITDFTVTSEVSQLLKDCCKSGLSLFDEISGNLLHKVALAISKTPESCLISSATSLFKRAVNSSQQKTSEFDLVGPCLGISHAFISKGISHADLEAHPDVAHEYFGFLWEVIQAKRGIVEQFPSPVVETIFAVALMNGLQVQEMLAYNTVLKFVRDFAAFGTEPLAPQIMQVLCKPIMERFLNSVLGAHPPNVMARITSTMLEVIIAYPTQSQQAVLEYLRQNPNISAKVDKSVTERFYKDLFG